MFLNENDRNSEHVSPVSLIRFIDTLFAETNELVQLMVYLSSNSPDRQDEQGIFHPLVYLK